jgi:transposase
MSSPETKPAAKKAAAKKAAPKAGATANKSQEVRKMAAQMKESGQQPRPSVIVAELAKKGVKVAPAQVSIVLKKMGFRPLRKKKGAKRAAAKAGAPRAAAKAAAGEVVSLEDVIAAKKAAAVLGGTEKAIAALQALKRIEG